MAKFQELRIGVFEELNRGFRACRGVVDESTIPTYDRQVIGIVRDSALHDLIALAFGKRAEITSHDLCNLRSMETEEVGSGRRSGNLPNMEDEVVFAEPVFVRLNQRGRGPLQLLASNAGGLTLEIRVPDPSASELYQGVPVSRDRQFEDQTQHTVVVVLDLAVEPFPRFEHQRF